MKLFVESNGRPLALADRIGGGGEADVYRVQGQPGVLAKIYKAAPATETVRKLGHMAANPPADPSAKMGHRSFAWPQELLINERSLVVGYVMPLAQGKEILNVFNPKLRALSGWKWNWREAHISAYNLAATMGALHAGNYVIGDVNESNVLVTQRALATLIDTDSFQVTVRDLNGQPVIYRCRVGKPEYTPPELQGKDFAQSYREPAHDLFGLGVLIFQLLMEGNHPFRGQWLPAGETPPLEVRISNGWFPYDKSLRRTLQPPADIPMLDQVMHPSVEALIKQCFITGAQNRQARPTAAQWMAALSEARSSLKICKSCGNYYAGHLKACPWCANAKPRPVVVSVAAASTTQKTAAKTSPLPVTPVRPATPRPQPAPPPRPKEQRWQRLGLTIGVLLLMAYVLIRGGLLPAPDFGPLAPIIRAMVPELLAPAHGNAQGELLAIAQGPNLFAQAASGANPAVSCDAQAIASRDGQAIPWRAKFSVTSVEPERDTITLNVALERTADTVNVWNAQSPNDSIWLQADGQRYWLLNTGGFPVQTLTLEPGVTHTGWFRFERPASNTFEFVHPNIQRKFMIDLADDGSWSCATQR